MGHSARAKFKREIRQQRLTTVIETRKDKSKRAAIQLALERAAAQPKSHDGSRPQFESLSKRLNAGRLPSSEKSNSARICVEEGAQEKRSKAAKWGVPVAALTDTKTRGKSTARTRICRLNKPK